MTEPAASGNPAGMVLEPSSSDDEGLIGLPDVEEEMPESLEDLQQHEATILAPASIQPFRYTNPYDIDGKFFRSMANSFLLKVLLKEKKTAVLFAMCLGLPDYADLMTQTLE